MSFITENDFITKNELTDKEIIFLDYTLDHYIEKKFWSFDIYFPESHYHLIKNNKVNTYNTDNIEDEFTFFISTIFSKNNNLFLEGDIYYFVLEKISKEAILSFNKSETFYFRFFKYDKVNGKHKEPFFILSCNHSLI